VVVEASLSLNDSCRPLSYQAFAHTARDICLSAASDSRTEIIKFMQLPRMQVLVFRYHESVRPIEYSTLHIYYPGKWIPTQSTRTQRCSAVQRTAYLFLALSRIVQATPATPHILTFAPNLLLLFCVGPAPQLDANGNAWHFFGRRKSGLGERARLRHLCLCACASLQDGWIHVPVHVVGVA
jgi:hypothetical protein